MRAALSETGRQTCQCDSPHLPLSKSEGQEEAEGTDELALMGAV